MKIQSYISEFISLRITRIKYHSFPSKTWKPHDIPLIPTGILNCDWSNHQLYFVVFRQSHSTEQQHFLFLRGSGSCDVLHVWCIFIQPWEPMLKLIILFSVCVIVNVIIQSVAWLLKLIILFYVYVIVNVITKSVAWKPIFGNSDYHPEDVKHFHATQITGQCCMKGEERRVDTKWKEGQETGLSVCGSLSLLSLGRAASSYAVRWTPVEWGRLIYNSLR